MHAHRRALSGDSGRLWRSLIGLLVAHAIAVQGLALGLLSPPKLAAAQGLPAFGLCLNGTHETPSAPADDQAPGTHCLLCMAGWEPVLDVPPACSPTPVRPEMGSALLASHVRQPLPSIERSIAQPRAPPAVG
jgi:hypothetical protein